MRPLWRPAFRAHVAAIMLTEVIGVSLRLRVRRLHVVGCTVAWLRLIRCNVVRCALPAARSLFARVALVLLLSDAPICQLAYDRSAPCDAIGVSGWFHAATRVAPLSAARCQLGRNARTHARAARSVGMAQAAAAARKTQEVPSAWRTTSRTHVTTTGFTSTDRPLAVVCSPLHVVSAARCLCRTVVRRTVVCRTLSLLHVVSAGLLSAACCPLLHFCLPHVVSAALSSLPHCCPPHCCLPHVVSAALSPTHVVRCILAALRSFAFCLLHVVFRTISAACCLLHVVCSMSSVACSMLSLSAARCAKLYLLHVVSCMLSASCCLLHVAWCRCMLSAARSFASCLLHFVF